MMRLIFEQIRAGGDSAHRFDGVAGLAADRHERLFDYFRIESSVLEHLSTRDPRLWEAVWELHANASDDFLRTDQL